MRTLNLGSFCSNTESFLCKHQCFRTLTDQRGTLTKQDADQSNQLKDIYGRLCTFEASLTRLNRAHAAPLKCMQSLLQKVPETEPPNLKDLHYAPVLLVGWSSNSSSIACLPSHVSAHSGNTSTVVTSSARAMPGHGRQGGESALLTSLNTFQNIAGTSQARASQKQSPLLEPLSVCGMVRDQETLGAVLVPTGS